MNHFFPKSLMSDKSVNFSTIFLSSYGFISDSVLNSLIFKLIPFPDGWGIVDWPEFVPSKSSFVWN